MSLRKITTLLLLTAFALTQVPAQAAQLSDEGETPPSVIADTGTPANGANRDVVPVNIVIETSGGEITFTTYTTAAVNTFTVLDNGALTVTGAATLVDDPKVIILTPPTGSEFVGLAGYNGTVLGIAEGGATDDANSFINVEALDPTQLPDTGVANAESMILAKIITENGAAGFFGGQTIPKGSVIIFTVTNQTSTSTNPLPADIKLENIGLAVDAGTSLPASLDVTYVEPSSSSVDEAVLTLADAATLEIATSTTDANGQIAVALDTTEPDNQSNAVLADLLATASNTVSVNTNNITSTTNGQTTLRVDTDALLIRAGETPASTMATPVYYDTPFNTSAFVTSNLIDGSNATILNTVLTNATSFPNTANALITVEYVLLPLTGNGSTDATLTVNAASVSLMDNGANGGFLGSVAVRPTDVNGDALTLDNFAATVLYNGASNTGALPVIDFDSLGETVTDLVTNSPTYGFDFTAAPDPLATTDAATTPFGVMNGVLAGGIFPGVTVAQADALGTTPGVVDNANPLTNNVNATGFAGATVGENIWVADELTARLLPTGGNAVFVFTGNEAGDDISASTQEIAGTNPSIVPYNQGAMLSSSDANNDVKNNVIAFANLTSNTVTILPIVNKVDSFRDVIKVRPEATITLATNSKTQGVRLVARVSGNTIAGTKEVEIARINAAGATDVDISVSAVPAAGALNALLAENGADESTLRVAIDPSTIDTTNTSISALVANGSQLDTTLPPFFCGGTAGNAVNGPNAVPQQPFARAIVVEEATAGAFDDAFVGGGNDVVRFTLPVGMDLVKTSTTANANDVAVISTDAGTAGTFSASPDIVDYQTVSEQNGSPAFIDISYSAAVSGGDAVQKSISLIFGQHSLVIPEDQADFTVSVSLVNDDGTSATTNDTVLDTVGTVSIIDSCATQFTISYCDDALSTFANASGPVETDMELNGSILTSFSNPTSSGIRLLNTSTTDFILPDICVSEAVPNAFFAGATATTPNIFGPGQTVSLGISDNNGTNSGFIGFVDVATDSITSSDDSLVFSAPAVAGGLVNSNVTLGGVDQFNQTTTARFRGITLNKTNTNFLPALQNINVFTNDGTSHIGTSLPASFELNANNGLALATNVGNEAILLGTFFNGDDFTGSGTANGDSGDFRNGNFLDIAFANSNAPTITNAVLTVNDNSSYDQLSEDTQISIAVEDVAAVTNGLAAHTRATIFTSTGALEPGSVITITSPDDSVTVPVTDDGNFIATLRVDQGDTLVVVQTPTSTDANADQTVVLNAEDQNLEPTLLSAASTNFAEIGTLTEQGTAPVLFTLTSVGRLNGETFKPTAAQLMVGDNPVFAVPGTDDQFISIIDFRKTNGNTVTANVDGSPSVVISGLDSAFPTFNKRTRPVLKRARTKTRKKDSTTRVVFKGKRLRNAGVGFIVLDDGSIQEVTFRKRTSNDRSKRRVVSEAAASIPTNALFAVYHVAGRGITTLDISN